MAAPCRLWKIAAVLGAVVLAGPPSVGQQSVDDLLKKGVVRPAKKSAPKAQQPANQRQTGPQAKKAATPAASDRIQAATVASEAFRMDLPPGWHAGLGQNGAVVAAGQGDVAVVIAPVLDAGETPAGTWLQRAGASAAARYLRNPMITGIYPSRMGARAALASFDYGGGQGTANALCLVSGGTGTLYVIAGPKTAFIKQRPGLVRILKSFSFTGGGHNGGESAQASPTGFTLFRDPKEGAFTVDVPAGWKVEGESVRKSPLDVRNFVWATSPDGAPVVHIGDPEFSSVPTRGQRYSPGPEFARQYAVKLAGDLQASNLQFTAVTPLEQLNGSKTLQGVGQTQTTGGEAEFTCTRNGRPYAGKVIAATTAHQLLLGFRMASLARLSACLAPRERLGEADRIMQHMTASMQADPQWLTMQLQLARKTSQIAKGAARYTARAFGELHHSREKSEEPIHQSRVDSVRGVPDFTELEQIR